MQQSGKKEGKEKGTTTRVELNHPGKITHPQRRVRHCVLRSKKKIPFWPFRQQRKIISKRLGKEGGGKKKKSHLCRASVPISTYKIKPLCLRKATNRRRRRGRRFDPIASRFKIGPCDEEVHSPIFPAQDSFAPKTRKRWIHQRMQMGGQHRGPFTVFASNLIKKKHSRGRCVATKRRKVAVGADEGKGVLIASPHRRVLQAYLGGEERDPRFLWPPGKGVIGAVERRKVGILGDTKA